MFELIRDKPVDKNNFLTREQRDPRQTGISQVCGYPESPNVPKGEELAAHRKLRPIAEGTATKELPVSPESADDDSRNLSQVSSYLGDSRNA